MILSKFSSVVFSSPYAIRNDGIVRANPLKCSRTVSSIDSLTRSRFLVSTSFIVSSHSSETVFFAISGSFSVKEFVTSLSFASNSSLTCFSVFPVSLRRASSSLRSDSTLFISMEYFPYARSTIRSVFCSSCFCNCLVSLAFRSSLYFSVVIPIIGATTFSLNTCFKLSTDLCSGVLALVISITFSFKASAILFSYNASPNSSSALPIIILLRRSTLPSSLTDK